MAATEGIGGFISVVATAPSSYDKTGYEALTFVEVEEVTEVPEWGPSHEVVNHTPLKTGIINKFHGALDYGSGDIPMAYSDGAAGQAILLAALASKDEISIKETRSDGSVRYTSGKVMSFTTSQQVGSVVPATARIELTRPTISVAAT